MRRLVSAACALLALGCGGSDRRSTPSGGSRPTPTCAGTSDSCGNTVGGVLCTSESGGRCAAGACTSAGTCDSGQTETCSNTQGSCGLVIGTVRCTSANGGTCTAGICTASGLCDTACSPSNCNGCCTSAGQCVAGSNVTACGKSGAVCQQCTVEQRCGSLGCEFDGTRRWSLSAGTGVIPERNSAGQTWDTLGGSPDPFVCVSSGGMTNCTTVAQDTTSPTWNEVLITTEASNLTNGVVVSLLDKDLSDDDEICSVNISIEPRHYQAGGYVLRCSGKARVNFALSQQ